MDIYVICSVRNASENEQEQIENYVKNMEEQNHQVFYPKRDAPQDDPTGEAIVKTELEAIQKADEIHVMWNPNSKGSHFDLGMAIALGKPIKPIIHLSAGDKKGKSYWKVMKLL